MQQHSNNNSVLNVKCDCWLIMLCTHIHTHARKNWQNASTPPMWTTSMKKSTPLPAWRHVDTLRSVCRHGWPISRQLSNKYNTLCAPLPSKAFRSAPSSEIVNQGSTLPVYQNQPSGGFADALAKPSAVSVSRSDTIWALYSPHNLQLFPPLILHAVFLPQTSMSVGSAAAWYVIPLDCPLATASSPPHSPATCAAIKSFRIL